MNTRLHLSTDRGKADYGWLKANYSFSFANYFNKDKIGFGMLRVLNDDTVAGGMGFGTHPHDNMEIITIPLEGSLKHRDSMGNQGVIQFGEVQVMSAGTGVEHSEINASPHDTTKILQIWILPEQKNVAPRYDQRTFNLQNNINRFVTVVSPHDDRLDDALWIYQQAYFNMGIFEARNTAQYKLRQQDNGLYLFLIEGEIICDNQTLHARDAMEITGAAEIDIEIREKSKVLLIEVPMTQ